jgi:hypothetical protein
MYGQTHLKDMFVSKTKISFISWNYALKITAKKSVCKYILIATGLILPRAYNFTFYIQTVILSTYPVKCKTVTNSMAISGSRFMQFSSGTTVG